MIGSRTNHPWRRSSQTGDRPASARGVGAAGASSEARPGPRAPRRRGRGLDGSRSDMADSRPGTGLRPLAAVAWHREVVIDPGRHGDARGHGHGRKQPTDEPALEQERLRQQHGPHRGVRGLPGLPQEAGDRWRQPLRRVEMDLPCVGPLRPLRRAWPPASGRPILEHPWPGSRDSGSASMISQRSTAPGAAGVLRKKYRLGGVDDHLGEIAPRS